MNANALLAMLTGTPTVANLGLFSGGSDTIRIVGFVTLGIGGLAVLMVGQRWGRRLLAGVRAYRVEPWQRIRPVADTLQLVIGLLVLTIGSLCLWLAGALRAIDVYQEKTLIGTLTYKGQTADGKMIMEYQEMTPDGTEVGAPILCQSHGDSIDLSYTIVRINDDFFIAGVEQMYKIDYIGGTYDDPVGGEAMERPHYEAIEGGRLKSYRDMKFAFDDGKEPPFPYNLFVSGVDLNNTHAIIIRDMDNPLASLPDPPKTWWLYLAHNTIYMQPTRVPPDDDEIAE